MASKAQGIEPRVGGEDIERHLHDTLQDGCKRCRGEITRGQAEADSLRRFLQVLQEVFLGSEELCADMAPANLNFAQLRLVFAHVALPRCSREG